MHLLVEGVEVEGNYANGGKVNEKGNYNSGKSDKGSSTIYTTQKL